MTDRSLSIPLRSEQFFAGFIAALAALGENALEGKRSQLHRAFYRAIRSEAIKSFPYLDQLGIDYDPLYGLSPWFDRALTCAQRDLLIDFTNPSYKKIVIRVEQEEGREQLKALGQQEEFIKLAQAFLKELQKQQESTISQPQ